MEKPFHLILAGGTGLLGTALLHHFGRPDYRLTVLTRSPDKVEELLHSTSCHHTSRAWPYDPANLSQLATVMKHLRAELPVPQGYVHNTVSRPMQGPDDVMANWEKSMLVNATGLFQLVRGVADWMSEEKEGSVVLVGSMQGRVGVRRELYGEGPFPPPDYFFHKGGLLNLTRYWAGWYGPAGLRFNLVAPGGILNPERPPPEKFLSSYAASTPLGRMAQAREIPPAVEFLLGPGASYITGAELVVDGGYTAL